MTEKINGQGFRPVDSAGTRRAEASKAARSDASAGAARDAAAGGSGDTVNITRSGLLMSQLEEIVRNAPAADTERVAAVKSQIAAGKYHVDDRKVADKLLRYERNLHD
jgi:negative regulator of flagellin synthesis FlgM